jgi:DNA helicase-2/ATP-dependent DNA helicase PcrA
MQAEHRHVLVDEFQDLTPAHVLMIRLLAAPGLDVYAVGDDDQTIYDHAGADPRFLIDHRRYFPGAGEHALEVNYRCPVAVIDAARHLLSYNDRRVAKEIRPGPHSDPSPDAVAVRLHPSEGGARELVSVVQGWLTGGADPVDVAVLSRVNSLLLAPHVALAEGGVPLSSNLRPDVLERLGLRAALAYLRIAADPDAVQPSDLVEVYRRPSRGLPNWIDKWLGKCRTVDGVSAAADRIDDEKVAGKLRQMHGDLHRLVQVARKGTTREVLVAVRDDIGLGSAMTLLDTSGGGDGSSHLDDLEALLQVADLHPDASTFEVWLRSTFHREADEGGVTLSTVHRVKGREWSHVAVFGVTEGIVPHRLAEDVEEERRVLHVAMTRAGTRLALLGDVARPSPFLSELDGSAPRGHVVRTAPAPGPGPAAKPRAVAEPGVVAARGLQLKVLGGYEGVVTDAETGGARLALDDGRSLYVRYGERVEVDGQSLALRSPFAAKAEELLRAWRLARSKADGVPAFVVLSDKHLQGIAERAPTTLAELAACPGIGPSKLDTYGDDILEVLATSAVALA